MSKLQVQYMGLNLANPIIVASSGLTGSPDKIAACARAGAGAIVVKSLFQEDIEVAINSLDTSSHPEGHDYVATMQTGFDLEKYCTLITNAKKQTETPIIASMNAFSKEWWVERLPQLEKAGADAIELNLALMPDARDLSRDEASIRTWYRDSVLAAVKAVSIPVSVKLGPYFTSIPLMLDELHRSGARAAVLFNRFYRLDIDIDSFGLRSATPFSTSDDLALPLRWISLMYGRVKPELIASSGIHTSKDMIKALLAGAQAGQVCSTLYQNGLDRIGEILQGLEAYMDKHHFESVAQFRGKASQKRSSTPHDYERIQYIKSLGGVS